jgi:hypothetical protein
LPPNKISDVTIEDAAIAFRNFEGREDKYNRAGDRNFALLLEEDTAIQLASAGWNVKRLKPRDDDPEGQAYLQVSVSFKNKPPRVMMITSRGITYMGDEQVEMLDWVDIAEADVTITAYPWTVGDKSGIKAYVKTLAIRIVEDYLQDKWTAWAEDQQRLREIEGPKDEYIDAEVLEEPLQIGGN